MEREGYKGNSSDADGGAERIAHDQELQGEICRADPSGPQGPEGFPGKSRQASSPKTDYGGRRRLS
jgi:hypothetical protein